MAYIIDKKQVRKTYEEKQQKGVAYSDYVWVECPYCHNETQINLDGCKCCTFCGKKLRI